MFGAEPVIKTENSKAPAGQVGGVELVGFFCAVEKAAAVEDDYAGKGAGRCFRAVDCQGVPFAMGTV